MASDAEINPLKPRSRRRRGKPLQDQRFSSYLTFGFQVTVCLGIFLAIYILVLISLTPLLSEETPKELKRGEALKPVMDPILNQLKRFPQEPMQGLAEGVAEAMRKQFAESRQKLGLSDSSLIEKASAEVNHLRKNRGVGDNPASLKAKEKLALHNVEPPAGVHGVIVLGMHRSGTSMLSGLMVTGSGYNTGGPLIGSAFDNEKGFFERLDVVLQNDEFMNSQKVWWSSNVLNYHDDVALANKESGKITFKKGKTALAFLNDSNNAPWLQKDPRMCITLKTWLPLLNNVPAILFTYRNPLEVAMSLKKREKNFTLEHGLRLWIIYNMRAIQNSEGLCRVYSSNDAILNDTLEEVKNIVSELTNKCGVPAPPRQITQEDVNKFVDPSLQHNKGHQHEGEKVLADYDGCKVYDYVSDFPEGSANRLREKELYIKAMKVHCDFKSGAAFEDDYEWPSV